MIQFESERFMNFEISSEKRRDLKFRYHRDGEGILYHSS